MIMRPVILAASALLLWQQGCETHKRPVSYKPPPTHRFENVPMVGAQGVALDTATGQWCKTWEWIYKSPNNPDAGSLDTLPTCLSLFRDTPAQDELPPERGMKLLKEGSVTTFNNGEQWTLEDGSPVRLK
jgi:hypothetical protein